MASRLGHVMRSQLSPSAQSSVPPPVQAPAVRLALQEQEARRMPG